MAPLRPILIKMILSKNQKKILDALLPVVEIAQYAKFREMTIKPRTHSLICAPSGAGKSHLMKELGKQTDQPVLLLNVSSWQPMGAKNQSTWDKIIEFIKENDKGIIVLDELDKLQGNSEWVMYLRLEIHDLLDGVIPISLISDSDEDDLLGDLWD